MTVATQPAGLTHEQLQALDGYWRAANYLSVGQIYIDRVPGLSDQAAWLRQRMADSLVRHRAWVCEYGEDLPEVRDWVWPGGSAASA
jgi:phosphoketolase